jgi:hypothetical protein
VNIKALQQIVGILPLPDTVLARNDLLKYADSRHVLGQMAVALNGKYSGKILDIFENALLRTHADHLMLEYEISRVERALSATDIQPIVLKGGAYVACMRRAAAGRRVSDLDIMVHESELDMTEAALLAAGWQRDEATDNAYDQSYYRKWMHELPPLRHEKRNTILDVHHRIIPRTSRVKIDNDALIADAVSVPGKRVRTFSDIDTFIHAAVHALGEGSFDTPARSLIELYYLFVDLSTQAQSRLIERADNVGAIRPVQLALWLVGEGFDRDDALALAKTAGGLWLLYGVKHAALAKLGTGLNAQLAKAFLYLRSHYLRMPLYLLVPHLLQKLSRWRPFRQRKIEMPMP